MNQIYWSMASVPVFGDWVRARDAFHRMNDYLTSYGIPWSDVAYPSQAPGAGAVGNFYRSGLNFVSKNLERLYR